MEVIIGTIVGIFGIHGEVKVKSNTDFASLRYQKGNQVILYSPIKKERIMQEIKSHKVNHKGLDIISFENFQTPESVEGFIGYQILIEKPQNSLNKGEYFYADLWHCSVYENGQYIGEVIDLFDGGASLILRIKRENKKDLLYPFVEQFIESIDIEDKRINLYPIEGMMD